MATPTPVNRPVFSLAGSQIESITKNPAGFFDPCPLGVRFFNPTTGVDMWATRYVGDIQYRSVVPGGFANATIPLHLPRGVGADQVGFSRIASLYTKVQVIDLRSADIAWEGRVETPARQVDPDTWQISALGNMIAASDVQRPVGYVDSELERWTAAEFMLIDGDFGGSVPEATSNDKDEDALTLTTTFNDHSFFDDSENEYHWRWDSHGINQPIARVTTTLEGSTTATISFPLSDLEALVATPDVAHLDATAYGSPATKTNVLGVDFTNTNTRVVMVGHTLKSGGGPSGSGGLWQVPSTGTTQQKCRNPSVVMQRRDRTGAALTSSSTYTHNYVLVSEVVEDVVGRFLCGGWDELNANFPLPGTVRPQDVHIDTTCTTQISHLMYPEGATAADILGDLIEQVQPDAYWAVWESHGGIIRSGLPTGARFEFSTWPDNFGYLATSEDGFEGQPDGSSVYNYVSYRYPDENDKNVSHVLTSALSSTDMAPELADGGFTRAITVNKTDPTDSTTAAYATLQFLADSRRVTNSGTLTVRRPIPLIDSGSTSFEGGLKMVEPHMIRPGKLVRIADLPPRTGTTDMSFGDVAPTLALDGTLFKVVAVNYSSSDNSAELELDEVTTWQIPTQIGKGGKGKSRAVKIQ